MSLSPMRFKDYVWPHNPRVYEIGFRWDLRAHRVPFGAYLLQNMGRQHRVLKGEGEFSGPGAYREFQKLATVFYDPAPGILVHPLWDTAKACFAALSLRQEPTENYVAYTFEFWEYCDAYTPVQAAPSAAPGTRTQPAQDSTEVYTVQRGDCIWRIAAAHGMTADALIALNPQIKNPNLIYPGDTLRLNYKEAVDECRDL